MDRRSKIAKRLKTLREQAGYSANQLAKMLGVTKDVYSNWENNRTKLSADYLVPLSDIYQMTVDEFLERKLPLVTKEQAIKESDPESIINRYYSLSKRSKGLVNCVIDYEINNPIITKKSKELYLAAAHGSEGMNDDELALLHEDIKDILEEDD